MFQRPNDPWGVTIAIAFVAGGWYVRANLPPRPGVYWLFPYPAKESPAELRRQAEASPEYQAALRTAEDSRNAMVFRALVIWVLGGVVLYGVASLPTGGLARHNGQKD